MHGRPSDRLLIAQLRVERLRHVSSDAALANHGGDIANI